MAWTKRKFYLRHPLTFKRFIADQKFVNEANKELGKLLDDSTTEIFSELNSNIMSLTKDVTAMRKVIANQKFVNELNRLNALNELAAYDQEIKI